MTDAADLEGCETVLDLKRRLADAEALLDAIREGQVDALVIGQAEKEHVYSLEGPELPYRQFLEQMGEGAVSLDAEGRVLFCNRFFASLTDRPREDILGLPFEDFLTPRCRAELRASLVEGGLGHLGLALVGKAGRELPVQVTVTSAGEESAQRFTLVVTDLSERERVRELSALQEASEAANQAKDQFLAYVGHDLRTPLQVIKGWTQYLLKRADELGD
ncbi:MAG TPA: PAS domain-containing protein, partial [Polyangia bacterium]